MATIKVKYRSLVSGGKTGTIFYQIIHDRQVRLLNSLYKISDNEWDSRRSMIILNHENAKRREYLYNLRYNIRLDIARLQRIVRRLEHEGLPYIVDDIVQRFYAYTADCSFLNYITEIVDNLQENGKHRTAETYRTTSNIFKRYLREAAKNPFWRSNPSAFLIDNITTETMQAFQTWQKGRGITPNTISFYFRILRAVYNRAVDQELIENKHPFRYVYTGIDKTVKRAISLQSIKSIKSLDLSTSSNLDFARDMFMLSFYLRGMSFIDMAYLRKTDLQNGYITYRRRKTGRLLVIKWTTEMQKIIDKYPMNSSQYLLPILIKSNCDKPLNYRKVCYTINYYLKQIAQLIDMPMPLTLYVARHSWASVAKLKGVPISVISEGMGHSSESTTQIYLSSLETSIVDKANSLILNSI